MRLEFRLFGDVQARIDGRPVEVGHARQQCVLAVLLVEANHPVSLDQLVDRVWGTGRLPDRPANTVQTYVSLLRRALAAGRGVVTIERQPTGYMLVLDEAGVDLHRFRRLIDQARSADDDDRATSLFREALALWRGEPFAALDTAWLGAIRATLHKDRQAARLDLTDIQLRRGQHTTLVVDLFDQVAAHPLDERLAGQLMLVLYRNGRRADALQHYRHVRHRLTTELGIEPGSPLQHLHQQILTADPALATPTQTPRTRLPVEPRQLPATPRMFTGRTRELAHLSNTLNAQADSGSAVMISVIGGTGGIGKTWLALHWAHHHLDRFPDGQLYVNLRGFDPTGQPMTPATAVRGFLDTLGVDPAVIPRQIDAQAGLYRSLVAGRRMLIVLDNAYDTDQVTPLLPGSPTCSVLITSRRRLTGLVTAHGARSLELDVLTQVEARGLLARHLGDDRLAAEPRATTQLLDCCAGLPLALGIVAARATSHRDFPVGVLADELRESAARLDALDGGDLMTNLPAVLSWSCRALSADAARVFGLVGLAPGPEISPAAVRSLTGLSTARVQTALRDLDNAHLVHQDSPGRYRMHDLVRLYATERAESDQSPNDRAAALRRLVDFYLHTAFAAERLLNPHRDAVDIDPAIHGCHPERLPDQTAALAWLDTEHPCLLAAQQVAVEQGWHSTVWQLAWTLSTYHRRRGHFHSQLLAWRAGLAAAQSDASDPQILAHRRIGLACARLGRHAEAVDHLRRALTLAERTGDLLGQAHTHQAFGLIWEQSAKDRLALAHTSRALSLFQSVGTSVQQAETRNGMGWYLARLGRYDQALAHCQAALTLLRTHDYRDGEANALDSLRHIAHHTGHHTEAIDYGHQALALYRELGHSYEEANTLDHLAQAHDALGQRDHARRAWRLALNLYRAQSRTSDAARIERELQSLT